MGQYTFNTQTKVVRARHGRTFQFEIEGGIFQSTWSFVVIARGGLCITGTGGEPGPRGTCVWKTWYVVSGGVTNKHSQSVAC